jgi:hypothetical protein
MNLLAESKQRKGLVDWLRVAWSAHGCLRCRREGQGRLVDGDMADLEVHGLHVVELLVFGREVGLV